MRSWLPRQSKCQASLAEGFGLLMIGVTPYFRAMSQN